MMNTSMSDSLLRARRNILLRGSTGKQRKKIMTAPSTNKKHISTDPFPELEHETESSLGSESDRTPTGILTVCTQEDSTKRSHHHHDKEKATKGVVWKDLEIKTYENILSDNPSVTSGAPIGIGWKVIETHKIDIDSYEKYHPERRTRVELALPASLREELLREIGYSRGELREVILETKEVKQKRYRNAVGSPWERFCHWLVSSRRKNNIAKKVKDVV